MKERKFTRKELYNRYGKENIICLPYCAAQCLLKYQNRAGWTERVEGWSSDIYLVRDFEGFKTDDLYNFVISTGYSPIGRKFKTKVDEYEKKAEKIIYDNSLSEKEEKYKLNRLLRAYFKKCLSESEV